MPVESIGGFSQFKQKCGFELELPNPDDMPKHIIDREGSKGAGLTSIRSEAFRDSGLSGKLTIPKLPKNLPQGVSKFEVGISAFRDCKKLEEVEFKSPAKIQEYAFMDCTSLKTVTLKEGIEKISDGTFKGCTKLSKINIPNSVTKIEKQAFANCKSLKSITFPKGLKTIEKDAFVGCTNLAQVVIPKGTKVEKGAFSSNTKVIDGSVAPTITLDKTGNNLCYTIEDEFGLQYYSITDPSGRIVAGTDYGNNPSTITQSKSGTVEIKKSGSYKIWAVNLNNNSTTKIENVTLKSSRKE